ncbi:MAG TPA: ATP-binding cassette domain-containing protein [Rectinemataceae bacterium]|nr:ATP-binding cassette domain-containing protein [Rectinemataceae bacterium]
MPEPLLELRAVSLRAAAKTIIDEVSLTFAEGESTVVMGASGSGKSSLVKIAAGIVPPDEGELLVGGKPFGALSKKEVLAFRRRSGFVFQDAALWANQSLFDNIAFPLRFHSPGLPPSELEGLVKRAAERAGLRRELSVRPSDISAGEAKLGGLARALVLDPEIIFLDDPLTDLDEGLRDGLSRLLVALGEGGKTIVLTGATPELARRMADFVVVIGEGRLRAAGSYEEASAWTSTAALGLTGRLLPRRRRGSLLGAWEEALSDDNEEAGGSVGPAPEEG